MKKKEVSAKYEEAWENFKQGKLEEAEECFAEVIPHVKAESWRASDLYHEYALVLRGLKKFGDAERYERMALNVAVEHNEVTSVVVTFARFTLGETLFCQNRFSEALEEIGRSIGIGAKQEWLLHFLKAKVLLKQ
ncbi:hypothetical protein [Thiosocius teredinicola]|uniref:hypothetical protein n=1 Tax=Thiosocius teredinicola TaxID=1973002 RepID=UPI0009912645